MKSKLKLIGLLLVGLIVGLNVSVVKAVNPSDDSVCGEGNLLHTNYYLFLDTGLRSSYDAKLEKESSWNYFTGAPKFNNIYSNIIPGTQIINKGQVAITRGNETTYSNASISWTAAEFWKYHYEAMESIINTGNKNKIYDRDAKTSFLFHNGSWWKYESDTQDDEDGEKQTGDNNSTSAKLHNYLKANLNNLASSDIVTKGTILPYSIIRSNVDPAEETISYFFRIQRTYTKEAISQAPGFKLGDYEDITYSPAVYYVQYCVKGNDKTYVVEYDGNAENVDNVPEDDEYSKADCTTISTEIPTREGYVFLGWSEDKNATKPDEKYAPGKGFCEGNLKLYAVWQKINVIDYDGNADNVDDVPKDDEFISGECTKISTTTPTREGYVFLGWSEDKNATKPNEKYAPGTEYCGDDITLYAVWQKLETNQYSVIYKPNTTDVVSNLPGIDIKDVGVATSISTIKPVRYGYTFLGWSTKEGATAPDHNYDGGKAYTEGKDLVLYAVWQKKSAEVNPKTGVKDYLIPFSSAALISGLGIVLLKKKKTYLQF